MNQQSIFRLALSGLVASSAVVIACSGAAPTGPSESPQAVSAGQDGRVGASAAGDVRVGSARLEIDSVRMDRQNPPGTSVLRQYAEPGREYPTLLGETIELWVEYDRGDGEFPSGSVSNPKLFVDWGDGASDEASCGSCRLSHTYRQARRYMVTVTLKDPGGTTVTRTFFLNFLPEAEPEPDTDTDTGTGTGTWTAFN